MEWMKDKLSYFFSADAWIIQVFVIVFLTLLLDFFIKIVLKRLEKKLAKTENRWDDAFVYAVKTPLSILVWVFGLYLASLVAKLEFVDDVLEVGVIFVIAWTLVRFIKQVQEKIIQHNEKIGKGIDRTTAEAISQLLSISVIITAALVGLQSLGFNISAILAFGGISGIAVGFAAKDLLANFFGGLMVYLDRPFSIGDWVRSPDRNIEGTVEKIGWRTSVIRTFDKRPLYIPNSVFATVAIENPSRMSHRRIYETVGIRYDDVSKLEDIIKDVKNMLLQHDEIDTSQTMIVNFNSFGPSSLDFFVYTFTKTTNWIKYHEVKQDVLFRINSVIEKHGAEIAFPTSTIHMSGNLNIEPESEINS